MYLGSHSLKSQLQTCSICCLQVLAFLAPLEKDKETKLDNNRSNQYFQIVCDDTF